MNNSSNNNTMKMRTKIDKNTYLNNKMNVLIIDRNDILYTSHTSYQDLIINDCFLFL